MNVVDPIKRKEDINKIKILLAANTRDLLLFLFGINSGLRISDILALNVCDVKNKENIILRENKTKKRKCIPINKVLKKIIRNYVTAKKDMEPLFKTRYNNRLDRVQAYRILNKVCLKVNPDLTIGTHTLRKTFGYHHYKQFHDVALLQKIFNHSSPSITMRYIGIEQDEIDESYNHFCL